MAANKASELSTDVFESSKTQSISIHDIARSGGRNIIDIRRDVERFSLTEEIHKGLNVPEGTEKRLPTLLLYDENGLKLFEEITYLDEYYLTNDEIDILTTKADQIAKHVQSGSILLELGSGNLRKVDLLLKAIDRQAKAVEYYALDLSLPELERTLAAVPKGWYQHVQCFGLLGTYEDGLEWLKQPQIMKRSKMVISLGSSIGNFLRQDGSEFLRSFADALDDADSLLLAVDGCEDRSKVYHAYNDRHGTTHKFVKNGLKHANKLLGKPAFDLDTWNASGNYNDAAGRHEAFVSPVHDVEVEGVLVRANEKVRIEESYKYSASQLKSLFQKAGIIETNSWYKETYGIHICSKVQHPFDGTPARYATDPLPSMAEWSQIWQRWDVVTRQMIPDDELREKPIKLRNSIIFYFGHLPTFADMKITESTGLPLTEPKYFARIFERGIDPDVDNPEHCHSHSEIPTEWPPLEEILEHQQRVRHRISNLYASGEAESPKLARCLWLAYEHEAMHLETLLYMLVQSEKTLPPSGVERPDFKSLAVEANKNAVPNDWIKVPAQTVVLGLDDPETTNGPKRHFGWDIEKPQRKTAVDAFEAKARPISVGEYADYLQSTGKDCLPASWTVSITNGQTVRAHSDDDTTHSFLRGKAVRTVYGPVSMEYCLDWPVAASYDELAGCAAWMGGRIPTHEEARSIYSLAESTKDMIGTTQSAIPAVNGQLINNGIQDSPPPNGDVSRGLDPEKTFIDVSSANVGFQHWHPTPVTHHGKALSGQADFGGLWEWTATPLSRHQGYEPMPLYPAYSSDFFDGKHHIVLGGSWATVPRIAGRRSFVNWYQHNYPYVWAGARVVRNTSE